eukprot:TRINITY_DN11291_c0_g1_i12.p1 TRINITY_DN11291_c0_g1~~TRINITY_DN11291_c0_g1_i12.p1  ORF type:complete len:268 (+),score=84.42 TRINITY_DN11291_c0_g1_i12:135-938(+)
MDTLMSFVSERLVDTIGEEESAQVLHIIRRKQLEFENSMEDEPDGRFLSISVSDPQKHEDGVRPFITYQIEGKTTIPKYPSEIIKVRRRYNEFDALYQELKITYPDSTVPEMPEKKAFGRFKKDFVETRQKGLDEFLRSVTLHKVFRNSDVLYRFLNNDIALDSYVIPPKPHAPSSSNFELRDLNSEEVGRQLTLMQFQVFKQIESREFLYINDSEERADAELSPHILESMEFDEFMTRWCAAEIVRCESVKERASHITFFLNVAAT